MTLLCNSTKGASQTFKFKAFAKHFSWCTNYFNLIIFRGFPGGSVVKNLSARAGDMWELVSIPGSGRSPGGVNGHTLQYSCLRNPKNGEAWWATVHGVTKSCSGLMIELVYTHVTIFRKITRMCHWIFYHGKQNYLFIIMLVKDVWPSAFVWREYRIVKTDFSMSLRMAWW